MLKLLQFFLMAIIMILLNSCGGNGNNLEDIVDTENNNIEIIDEILDRNSTSYAPMYELNEIASQVEYYDALGKPIDSSFGAIKVQDLIYYLDIDESHVYMITQRGKLIIDDNVTDLFEKPLRSVVATGTKLAVLGYDGVISFVSISESPHIDASLSVKNYQKISKTRDSNIIYALANDGTVDIIDIQNSTVVHSFKSEVTFGAMYIDFAIGKNLALFQSYTGEMAVYDISDILNPKFKQSHPFNPSHFTITSSDDIYALDNYSLMHIKYQYDALYKVSQVNIDTNELFFARDLKVDELDKKLYILVAYDGKGTLYGYDISQEQLKQTIGKYLDIEDSPGHFIFPYAGKVFGLWYGELREIQLSPNDTKIKEGKLLSEMLPIGFKGLESFDGKGFRIEYQFSKIYYINEQQKLLVPAYGKTGSIIYLVDVKDGSFKVERFFVDDNAYARMYSNVSISQDNIFINSGYHVLMLDFSLNLQYRIPHLVIHSNDGFFADNLLKHFWLDYYTPELTFIISSNKLGEDIFLHNPTGMARCRIENKKAHIYLPKICGTEVCSEYDFGVPEASYGFAILPDENSSKLYFKQTGRLSAFQDSVFQLDINRMSFPYSSDLSVFTDLELGSFDDYGYWAFGEEYFYYVEHASPFSNEFEKIALLITHHKENGLTKSYPIEFSIDAVIAYNDKLYAAGSNFIGELDQDMNITQEQSESFESNIRGLQFDGYYFYVSTDSKVFAKRKTFYATWAEYIQHKKVYFDETHPYRPTFKVEMIVQGKNDSSIYFSRCDLSSDGTINNCSSEFDTTKYHLYQVYLFDDINSNSIRDGNEEDFVLHENATVWEWN